MTKHLTAGDYRFSKPWDTDADTPSPQWQSPASSKVPYVFTIIGGRKVNQLLANLAVLDISLSDAQMNKLESAVDSNPGLLGNVVVSTLILVLSGVF
jgi:hypothetical protein